jgi:hypothetical protein
MASFTGNEAIRKTGERFAKYDIVAVAGLKDVLLGPHGFCLLGASVLSSRQTK